jgi:hypothetical protein
MAGQLDTEAARDEDVLLPPEQVAGLLRAVEQPMDDERAALCAAHALGWAGGQNGLKAVVRKLEAAARAVAAADVSSSPGSPAHQRSAVGKAEHQQSVAGESMLGTALTCFGAAAATPAICAAVEAASCPHYKALLLDCLVDTAGSLAAGSQAHQCFADCLQDADPWVRHNAMQGLEMAGQAGRPHRAAVAAKLGPEEPEPFVRFAAISALAYATASADTEEREALGTMLRPLLSPEQHDLVRWKAAETIYMLARGFTRSCL